MTYQNLPPTGDKPTYNNCFVLGQKRKINGKLIKVPVYIDTYHEEIKVLFGGKDGIQRKHYELSYQQAKENFYYYWGCERRTEGDEDLRISLYLDNAKYGNLHIFVLDFDDYDEESQFFKEAQQLADKVTRSQGGGYHMFYGVDKEAATPLFDSINLLASENALSFVCKTGAVTLDGTNKVDMFCDTRRLMYEWELWDNTIGLTDKTQELYQLIKGNFSLEKSKSYKQSSSGNTTTQHRWAICKSGKKVASNSDAEYQGVIIEGKTESELKSEMTDKQREIFEDLKNISADCSERSWTSVAYDIWFAFQTDDGDELAAQVFLWWSKRGSKSYEPFQCVRKWEFVNELCSTGQRTLSNGRWQAIMCRGEVVNEEETQQHADVPEDNPTLPLPLEYDLPDMLEDETAAASLPKGQFRFGDLIVQRQENSSRFLLPNRENKSVTAYDVIGLLSGSAFKSYKKHVRPLNDKLQVLPYSERYRAIFYFRRMYKLPPPLNNGNEIAKFIDFALSHTTNVELSQNWRACLDVSNTEEEAAALLAYYGWAPDFQEELPRTENAFYTVEAESGVRHYEIVSDDIILRFEAIQQEARTNIGVRFAIGSKKLSRKEKYNRLQAILKPSLWWRNGVRMGLIKPALDECDLRIGSYIEALLNYNAIDGIPLEEHIYRVELDKSAPGFAWATPRSFDVSMQDLAFEDYQYNISPDFNRENAAELGKARSRAAAERNFAAVKGDEWTAAELAAQEIDKDKIPRLIKNGLIERVGRNHYRRISS